MTTWNWFWAAGLLLVASPGAAEGPENHPWEVIGPIPVYFDGDPNNYDAACSFAEHFGGDCRKAKGEPKAGARLVTDGKPFAIFVGPNAHVNCQTAAKGDRAEGRKSSCRPHPVG